jgi:hypothetical protein
MRKWTAIAIAGILVGGLLLAGLPAQAGTYAPRIDAREAYQQARIQQGVNSGQITPREYYRLERQQARIRAAEARMKADGRLTRRERARLHQMLNNSSRSIYYAKHNYCQVR